MNNLISKEQLDYIKNTCNKYAIRGVEINNDGSLNVSRSVNLANLETPIKELPLNFNIVEGDFYCMGNSLTTLKGAPKKVGGDFLCQENELTNLEFSPTEVGGRYDCAENQITSLVGMPKEINGNFLCDNNRLESFIGGPTRVGGDQIKAHDNYLTTLIGAPTSFFGDLYIDTNRLPSGFHRYRFDSYEEVSIFLKYQEAYEVWTPEFNEANMADLFEDIKEGLR